jgi:hypothetical protein
MAITLNALKVITAFISLPACLESVVLAQPGFAEA